MIRTITTLSAVMLLSVGLAGAPSCATAATPTSGAPSSGAEEPRDLFDVMQSGEVEAKFIAKDSKQGRIVLENKTDQPIHVSIPEAFIGVPMAQFGGGMGGGMMGGGMGGQQSVGGGGGRGGRGGGRGGGFGGGRGGGRGGGFSVPPEKTVRIDVPLLCLDHGLREPSSSKPYAIRPIENFIQDPAVIEIVASYANGDLPTGAAQAAVWNLNSEVSWNELAAKLTGTERNVVREPYFSQDEIQTAMAIVSRARELTAGVKVEPREFELPGEQSAQDPAEYQSPGEEVSSDAAANQGSADSAAETESVSPTTSADSSVTG